MGGAVCTTDRTSIGPNTRRADRDQATAFSQEERKQLASESRQSRLPLTMPAYALAARLTKLTRAKKSGYRKDSKLAGRNAYNSCNLGSNI